MNERVAIQFTDTDGNPAGPVIDAPISCGPQQLSQILNALLENTESTPYSFFIDTHEILNNLAATMSSAGTSTEETINVIYHPQALFKVKPVTRCSSDLPGHQQAIVCVTFSPDGNLLATGSGDATIKIWDPKSQLPKATLKGHRSWVLFCSFSPDANRLASGSKDAEILIWDPKKGEQRGKALRGHQKFITSIAWEPYHANPECRRLISGSGDNTARVWDSVSGACLATLGGHTDTVTCVAWGGNGVIYTASKDRTIRLWDAKTYECLRILRGHGHWVNFISLSTAYALRCGPFDHRGEAAETQEQRLKDAKARYKEACAVAGGERLASASDDFMIFLWPAIADAPAACSIVKQQHRLCGHQQPVNQIIFSPDARYLASASFDHSIRIWDAHTGKLLHTLRGHVSAVYQVAFSADSRLLVSASKDSTLKCWNVATGKLAENLPGHADQVYAVDWSPDGSRVCSGSKDKLVKIWSH